MSNSYVLGIAVGIAFGIMLVAFIFSYLKKKGKDICEYDERQKLAQLKGWKAAFIAAVCFDIINAAVVEARGPWSGMMVMAICSLYVGIGAYAAVCIVKDAYTPLHRSAGRYILLLLALALVNIAIGALNCQSTGLIKNGMLTMSWVNFFAAALLIGIDAVYAIDVLVKRRRAGGLEMEE